MSYGTITIGRITLREAFTAEEKAPVRTLAVQGEESQPPLTATQLLARHQGILALEDTTVLPVTWTDKPSLDGYYQVKGSDSDLTERQGEVATAVWKLDLARIGTEVDLESRLTGTVRANDFGLSGERWHAPPIGHYAYYTGTTQPAIMTRTSEDGAIIVYRGIPSGVSPRWGCAPGDYGGGRVRVLSEDAELTGVTSTVAADDWELSNALVRVRPSGGQLLVAAYDGTQWEGKVWNVTVGASTVASWEAANILRNDYEQAVLRLTRSRAPGRTTLDLTLRRGARTVEGYLQADSSGTLSVSLATAENTTAPASSGYVVATSADAAGNKYTAGSARNFTAHASGGISKAAATTLDFYLGAVVNASATASGDAATDLRDMYIGAMAEFTVGVRR